MTTHLPALPEEIILTDEQMGLEPITDLEIGGYDEFQMLAEHQMIKERTAAKQHREARRSW